MNHVVPEVADSSDEPQVNSFQNVEMEDIVSDLQAGLQHQIEKFTDQFKMIIQQRVNPDHTQTQQQIQLRKAQLLVEIQSLVAFITNEINEHHMMQQSEP